MIIKCPHCYLRVLPKKDNTCPSCGNNVLDVFKDAEYDLVELKNEQKLPDVCITCGESTNSKVKVKYSHRYGPKYFFSLKLFIILNVLLFLLFISYLILTFLLNIEEGDIKYSSFVILVAIPTSITGNFDCFIFNPESKACKNKAIFTCM